MLFSLLLTISQIDNTVRGEIYDIQFNSANMIVYKGANKEQAPFTILYRYLYNI